MSRVRHFGLLTSAPLVTGSPAPADGPKLWIMTYSAFAKLYWRLASCGFEAVVGNATIGSVSFSLQAGGERLKDGVAVADERELCFPGLDQVGITSVESFLMTDHDDNWNGSNGVKDAVVEFSFSTQGPGAAQYEIYTDPYIGVYVTIRCTFTVTTPGLSFGASGTNQSAGVFNANCEIKYGSGSAYRADEPLGYDTTDFTSISLDLQLLTSFLYNGPEGDVWNSDFEDDTLVQGTTYFVPM